MRDRRGFVFAAVYGAATTTVAYLLAAGSLVWFIAIMVGDSEQDMQRQLEKAGAIGPETKINIDPRLK